jgi:hypothetical protein
MSRVGQVKDALKKIFDLVDADHNGKIDKAEAKALMDKFRDAADSRFEEAVVPGRTLNVIFRSPLPAPRPPPIGQQSLQQHQPTPASISSLPPRNLDIDGNGGLDFEECFLAFRQAQSENFEGQLEDMRAMEFVEGLDHIEGVRLAIETNDFTNLPQGMVDSALHTADEYAADDN